MNLKNNLGNEAPLGEAFKEKQNNNLQKDDQMSGDFGIRKKKENMYTYKTPHYFNSYSWFRREFPLYPTHEDEVARNIKNEMGDIKKKGQFSANRNMKCEYKTVFVAKKPQDGFQLEEGEGSRKISINGYKRSLQESAELKGNNQNGPDYKENYSKDNGKWKDVRRRYNHKRRYSQNTYYQQWNPADYMRTDNYFPERQRRRGWEYCSPWAHNRKYQNSYEF